MKTPILVQEQRRYTYQQLSAFFARCGVEDEHIIHIIRKLKEFGLLKNVKAKDEQRDMSELLEGDISVTDVEIGDSLHYYVFTFVGIIIVNGVVFESYPKYIDKSDPSEELKLVLRVLRKYNSKNEIIRLFNETNESKAFNLLAILLFFLRDYHENGSYRNSEAIIETNGRGEILWDKTINDTFALICRNRPFYTDLQTIRRVDDDYDYFRRLHECVITIASKELKNAGLLDLFELTDVNLSDECLADFGETEYILYRLGRELNVQFNSWKQLILKALYAYVNHSGHLADMDQFSVYGTTSFNLVWEDVCSKVLNDKLHLPLKSIESELPKPLLSKYKKTEGKLEGRLIDIIERPFWSYANMLAPDTLRPDIVVIEKVDDKYMFVIVDAKYYAPRLEKGKVPKNQPGLESITKQYLYQLAFSDFVKDQGFSENCIRNCFLLPTENTNEVDKGEVSMRMFEDLPSSPKLKRIQVRYLLASKAYECYLNSRIMKLEVLNL